jgi:leucine-rich PPR motif-containing protein
MKLSGISANEIIYGCLLNACVKCSKIEKACDIYDELQNSDIQMNIVIYTTLIKGYTRIKNFEKAFEIYNKLLNDISVQANTVTYNAILDCCVECGDYNMMIKIYEELRENAINDENAAQPDLITYSTVIKGFSRLKKFEKVMDIYNYLRGRDDITLDEVIYNSILDGLLKSEKYEEALKVYEDMMANKIKGSNATYSILIKIYSKMNNVNKAVDVYNQMLEENIKPSLITYTSIIQILIKSKRIQNAISIFDEILFNGLNPDHVMYNVIINGCVFNGRLDDACRFLMKSFTANLRLCNDVYKNVLGNLLTNRIMNYNYKIELTMKSARN